VEDELGRMGLKFWDDVEKNKFFTFIAKCWKYYLDKGFKHLVELNREINGVNISSLKRMEVISDVVDENLDEINSRIKNNTLYADDLYDMYKKYCEVEGIKHTFKRKVAVERIKTDIENRLGIILRSVVVRGTNNAVVRKYVAVDIEDDGVQNDALQFKDDISIADDELDF